MGASMTRRCDIREACDYVLLKIKDVDKKLSRLTKSTQAHIRGVSVKDISDCVDLLHRNYDIIYTASVSIFLEPVNDKVKQVRLFTSRPDMFNLVQVESSLEATMEAINDAELFLTTDVIENRPLNKSGGAKGKIERLAVDARIQAAKDALVILEQLKLILIVFNQK